jgi:uncharacterized protein YbaR (Trm112 family)
MHVATLELLRCPYCGGRLDLVTSMFHERAGDQIRSGILGCHCCIFPVVDGIPVLHLQSAATTARDHVEAGHPHLALRAMFGLTTERNATAFEAAAASESSTYRELVDALGPRLEAGYFLYRFSDPTYVVANAVVRAVAGTVLAGRRAVDVCGGSGHLTRSLLDLSSHAPVLADLYFAKVWLARRFTAPGCEPVCCDGNAPLPFARAAFGFAMCSDALQYIWTKRQFVGELTRLIDGGEPGAVVINHAHNQLAWSPSHGQPLSPAGYRDLFEEIEPRMFAETALLSDIVAGGPLDLTPRQPPAALNAEPALAIVASRHPDLFRRHALTEAPLNGEYRVNPMYSVEQRDTTLRLRLEFPDPAYEDEYGACRQYLPDELTIDRRALEALQAGGPAAALADLIRRRVIIDLPKRYC